MGDISYTAHVSNKRSVITSKSKLLTIAKHNQRKYKSSDYSKDIIFIIYGRSNPDWWCKDSISQRIWWGIRRI